MMGVDMSELLGLQEKLIYESFLSKSKDKGEQPEVDMAIEILLYRSIDGLE